MLWINWNIVISPDIQINNIKLIKIIYTRFYAYSYPFYNKRPTEIMYSKSKDNNRDKMTVDELRELLANPDINIRDKLRKNYGFHSEHMLKFRTDEEKKNFDEICKNLEKVQQQLKNGSLSNEELEAILHNKTFIHILSNPTTGSPQ